VTGFQWHGRYSLTVPRYSPIRWWRLVRYPLLLLCLLRSHWSWAALRVIPFRLAFLCMRRIAFCDGLFTPVVFRCQSFTASPMMTHRMVNIQSMVSDQCENSR